MQPSSHQPQQGPTPVLGRVDGRVLVDAIRDAVVVGDTTNRVRHVNHAAERLLGWERGELTGRPLTDIIPARLREAHTAGFTRFLATGDPHLIGRPTRLPALRRDGTEIEVDLVVSAFGSGDRRIFVAALHDISDRIELERQRRSATYLQATTEVAVRLALAEERSLHAVGPLVLEAIGETLVWDVGAMWEADPGTGQLRSTSVWVRPGAAAPALVQATRNLTFEPGGGLPGLVLERGEAAWVAAFPEAGYARSAAAGEAGLHTAFAFPVLGEHGPLAAVEFFHRASAAPDPELLSAMKTIGSHVGRLVDAARMQREVQTRLTFLARATSLLEAALDLDATLARVADLAVPYLADACIIELCEGDELIPAAAASRRRRLERALRSRGPAARALETGALQTYEPGGGLSAAVAIPLVARGAHFGVMSLGVEAPKPPFTDAGLTLAADLAQRAALAVDGARRYGERSYVAQKLQEVLLPRRLPHIAGLDCAVRYLAAGGGVDVGGDFYDVFDGGGDGWGFVVGDVVGKGVEAAAVTGVARHTLRALAQHDRSPAALLRGLNRALLQEGDDRFCTVCLVRMERSSEGYEATISLGGHLEPLLIRRDGMVEAVGRPGTLLGAFDHVAVSDQSVTLEPGDALVLYTDGVTERHRDDEQFGTERLAALVASLAGAAAESIAGAVERAVVEFDDAARDDVAILVVRVRDRAVTGSDG